MTKTPNAAQTAKQPIEPPEPWLTPAEMIERAERMRSVLRERQARCEQLGRLPDETNDEFVRAGFYRIVQPRCFGGYEFDLITFARVMMEVARGCLQSGWTLALTAGHPAAFLSAFPEQGQREAYGEGGECRAPGVAMPGGIAIPEDGGYRVTAAWDYCSGADIGTHFLGGMIAPVPGSNMPRAHMYVLIQRQDYEIIDNWDVFGMVGTGSRRVVVKDLFVPAHRTLEMAEFTESHILSIRNQPGRALHANPLYHGPLVPLLLFEVGAVAVGGARGALDVYEQMLREKKTKLPPVAPLFELPDPQRRFGEAQALIDTAEGSLLTLAANYTELCRLEKTEGVEFSEAAARRMHRAQQQCVELAWQSVDLLFRSAGTSAATKMSTLGRYFRDLAVMRTHLVLQLDHTSTNVGRLHFGLQPLSAW